MIVSKDVELSFSKLALLEGMIRGIRNLFGFIPSKRQVIYPGAYVMRSSTFDKRTSIHAYGHMFDIRPDRGV